MGVNTSNHLSGMVEHVEGPPDIWASHSNNQSLVVKAADAVASFRNLTYMLWFHTDLDLYTI